MYQALVDFKYWTFIAQICNLLIQMLLFKKFLFKPVQAVIAKRQQEVGQIYTDANQARTEAERDKTEYAQRLQTANEEAARIVRNASERAGKQGDEIIQEAQSRAQSMLKKADEDIAQERVKAMNEIKNDISEMAMDIAQKVVEREINPDDHSALIAEFIASVGEDA